MRAVILMSHLGRPEEGRFDEALSPFAPSPTGSANCWVAGIELIDGWENGVEVEQGQAVLLENVRFQRGEKADDPDLAARLAGSCAMFSRWTPSAPPTAPTPAPTGWRGWLRWLAPGRCWSGNSRRLAAALEHPQPPTAAIVGGSKVSTKLGVLQTLAGKVDTLILGGGIANTLLAAADHPVGRSLHEPDMLRFAGRLLGGEFGSADIPLPSDVVVAESLNESVHGTVRDVDRVGGNEMILDIGPRTAAEYARRLRRSGTILWNGPVGVFEHPEFAGGTEVVSKAVAASDAFSIAGGGDTLAAIQQFGVSNGVSYLSTGGGAFLEFLEGRELPAVEVLKARASANSRN